VAHIREEARVLTVGIDAHFRLFVVCVLDEAGAMVQEFTVRGGAQDLTERLRELPRPFQACFEASTGYGLLHDTLAPIAARVIVAHPGKLRLVFQSRRKTDRIDAQKLARLLLLGQVPAVHVPALEVREWRALIEHRRGLVDKRTRAKNALRALLRTHGHHAPRGHAMWARAGKGWAAGLAFASPLTALKRDQLLEEVEHFDRAIALAEKQLGQVAAARADVVLLRTMPGVGPRTAEAVAAYVDQAGRFARSRSACAYFGLVPGLDQSAGRSRAGGITREGPATARKMLTEAAWQGVRRSATLRAFYERIHGGRKDRKAAALVATARHMVKVMVAMLKSGEAWRESTQEAGTAAA
jgi:transposase